MSLAAQIIDQQVAGIVEKLSDTFTSELRLGTDEHRRRSIAFLFLVAKTAFDLTDEQTTDGIVDVSLGQLDHRNFGAARERVRQQSDDYLARAEAQVGDALDPLLSARERTLQRLSATFRRADLVETLLETAQARRVTAPTGPVGGDRPIPTQRATQ